METLGPCSKAPWDDLRTRRQRTRAGRAVETAIGDTLTLGYRILNHKESRGSRPSKALANTLTAC